MPITPTILAGIREQFEYVAKRGHAERTIDAVRRATVVVCGQVLYVSDTDGKRVAKFGRRMVAMRTGIPRGLSGRYGSFSACVSESQDCTVEAATYAEMASPGSAGSHGNYRYAYEGW